MLLHEDQTGIPVSRQLNTFNGKLVKEYLTLAEMNIRNHHTLQFRPREYGF
jgi:hypothetical protein